MNWTPTPATYKFDQPPKMSDKDKGFWLGLIIGNLLTNLIWYLLIK